MNTTKALGAILIVVGIALAIYGSNLQNSLGSQIGEVFGQTNNTANTYIIGGVASAVIGIILFFYRGKR